MQGLSERHLPLRKSLTHSHKILQSESLASQNMNRYCAESTDLSARTVNVTDDEDQTNTPHHMYRSLSDTNTSYRQHKMGQPEPTEG